jgi:hypothetical protein
VYRCTRHLYTIGDLYKVVAGSAWGKGQRGRNPELGE